MEKHISMIEKIYRTEKGPVHYWIGGSAGAGHNSNTDEPEKINKLIEGFMGAP